MHPLFFGSPSRFFTAFETSLLRANKKGFLSSSFNLKSLLNITKRLVVFRPILFRRALERKRKRTAATATPRVKGFFTASRHPPSLVHLFLSALAPASNLMIIPFCTFERERAERKIEAGILNSRRVLKGVNDWLSLSKRVTKFYFMCKTFALAMVGIVTDAAPRVKNYETPFRGPSYTCMYKLLFCCPH